MAILFGSSSDPDDFPIWSGKPRDATKVPPNAKLIVSTRGKLTPNTSKPVVSAAFATKNPPELKSGSRTFLTLRDGSTIEIDNGSFDPFSDGPVGMLRRQCPKCGSDESQHRHTASNRDECTYCGAAWNPALLLDEMQAAQPKCPTCRGEFYAMLGRNHGGDMLCQCTACNVQFTFRKPPIDPTLMRCADCGHNVWTRIRAFEYKCVHCFKLRRSDVATEAEFTAEWHQLLALYGVWNNARASDATHSEIMAEATAAISRRMRQHGLGDGPHELDGLAMGEVIDRLAPRRMMRPARDDRFGPAVTAETPDEFEAIMRAEKEKLTLKLMSLAAQEAKARVERQDSEVHARSELARMMQRGIDENGTMVMKLDAEWDKLVRAAKPGDVLNVELNVTID